MVVIILIEEHGDLLGLEICIIIRKITINYCMPIHWFFRLRLGEIFGGKVPPSPYHSLGTAVWS